MTNIRKIFSKFKRANKGVTTVEFAIISPVLFLITMGTVETGLVLYATSVLEGAANSAVRTAKVRSSQGYSYVEYYFKNEVDDKALGLLDQSGIVFDWSSHDSEWVTNEGFASGIQMMNVYYDWDITTPLVSQLMGDKHRIHVGVPVSFEPGTQNL